jgi:hypothetical protein
MEENRHARRLAMSLLLVAGCTSCAGGAGGGAPVASPTPSPSPTRPARVTTLPADWDLPFPPGTVIEAVNWEDPDPARDRVQLRLPIGTEAGPYFRQALEARGLKVTERVTDGSSRFLEAEKAPTAERFGVEITASGVVMVTRHRAKH